MHHRVQCGSKVINGAGRPNPAEFDFIALMLSFHYFADCDIASKGCHLSPKLSNRYPLVIGLSLSDIHIPSNERGHVVMMSHRPIIRDLVWATSVILNNILTSP